MNQTVLITGAGSGFGLGASLELARRGYDVIATTQILAQITGVKPQPWRLGWNCEQRSSMYKILLIVKELKIGMSTFW